MGRNASMLVQRITPLFTRRTCEAYKKYVLNLWMWCSAKRWSPDQTAVRFQVFQDGTWYRARRSRRRETCQNSYFQRYGDTTKQHFGLQNTLTIDQLARRATNFVTARDTNTEDQSPGAVAVLDVYIRFWHLQLSSQRSQTKKLYVKMLCLRSSLAILPSKNHLQKRVYGTHGFFDKSSSNNGLCWRKLSRIWTASPLHQSVAIW